MTQPNPKPGFNLSRWALEHVALTRYLMLVLMLLGFAAYFQLGQDEDPPFAFRVMVVRVLWPGATAQQMAEQVTDKIERTLQEVPGADKIRSYSKPGESQIVFQLKDSTRAADVPNAWYSVPKRVADMSSTLPSGVRGPFFNDDFGDVYGVIYALEADGFSNAELKTFADDVRQQLLRLVQAVLHRHASRADRGYHDSAGVGDDLHRHVLLGHRPAQDIARLADHLAWTAGG